MINFKRNYSMRLKRTPIYSRERSHNVKGGHQSTPFPPFLAELRISPTLFHFAYRLNTGYSQRSEDRNKEKDFLSGGFGVCILFIYYSKRQICQRNSQNILIIYCFY